MQDTQVTINQQNVLLRVVFGFPHKHRYSKNQKVTVCQIFGKRENDENFTFVNKGIARCNHDLGDTFDKLTGKKVSLEKALKIFEDKEVRETVWKNFFLEHPLVDKRDLKIQELESQLELLDSYIEQ